MIKKSMNFFGRELTIETGRMAKQAHGSVVVSYGDTQILVTTVSKYKASADVGFFPLSVDFIEKKYAAGRMPGGFFKREARPSTKEVLSARLIDRPIRPLFPKDYKNETQVIITVISHDGVNEADVLGCLGASTALNISDIPFQEPVASVRVIRVDGEFVVNPTFEQMEEADIELVVAATKENIAMIEGEASEVPEAEILEAVTFGHDAIKQLISFQEELVSECAKEKREFVEPEFPEGLAEKVTTLSKARLIEANKLTIKEERRAAIDVIYDEVIAAIVEEDEEMAAYAGYMKDVMHDIEKVDVRTRILKEGSRLDGRGLADLRELTSEIGILKRAHGSALFTRGQTQALGVTTLGTKQDEQSTDNLEGEKSQSYYLHYNFPPFCTGEVKRMFGVSRRELGHGNLAERSLKPILPAEQSFPYTIRIVSEVLESNGSSSMATICAASLSLMHAGVPIKTPVAGIAMGLIKEGDDIAVLTDILGDEDHLGDMDFKVAGTRDGITAFQMDIKIDGISTDIMAQAMHQARDAREQILDNMEATISKPNDDLSEFAPRILQIRIPQEEIGMVIGPGGKMIREIIEKTGVAIDIDDSGIVNIASTNSEKANEAKAIVEGLVAEVEQGKIYMGKVVKIADFGAFMEVLPGKDGLLHISEYDWKRIDDLNTVLKVGDTFEVIVKRKEANGKVGLSRKALIERPEREEKPADAEKKDAPAKADSSDKA